MASRVLILGNKNYSSWSFRPWIAMRHTGIGFEERVIPLFAAGYKDKILAYSPAGQVPVLALDEMSIWGSVAILEYAADAFPQAALWPDDQLVRAHARSIVGEMHSGFTALRGALPMNIRRAPGAIDYDDAVAADIHRIERIWADCRERYGDGGPFLFGRFSIADAMYAPVVSRLHIYDVRVGDVARVYMDAMMALPAWREWADSSAKEPWVIDRLEL